LAEQFDLNARFVPVHPRLLPDVYRHFAPAVIQTNRGSFPIWHHPGLRTRTDHREGCPFGKRETVKPPLGIPG
ncbi:MAG TPA: hypothetical protein VKB09_00665, partial [Thermomicrobiales bacterium]|nr:hypothetical protein [Thermomicrobiales bacterium]